MKKLISLLITLIMTAATSSAQSSTGKATTTRTTFSRETTVSIDIHAGDSIVWALLTKAPDYPRWNSTVVSIEGSIALGEKIKLKSTLDTSRTFKLKVKEFVPGKKLVWGDGQGQRVFTITKNAAGSITFTMTEKIGGMMFPLYAKMIPSFDQSFEQFAADLKKEAETIMNAK
jgi:uncharacterized protein YndB with AHSA1/START domain